VALAPAIPITLTPIMDAAPSSVPEEGITALPPPAVPVADAAATGASVPTLSALTRRMAGGAEDAFREFHAAWFQRLFRYVFVLMRGNEAAACDVTQETLLRVVRHIRAFEGGTSSGAGSPAWPAAPPPTTAARSPATGACWRSSPANPAALPRSLSWI
jgi:hypothetical protein